MPFLYNIALVMYASFFSSEPLHIALLSLLGLMTAIQLFYYFRYYRRAAYFKTEKKEDSNTTPPLSVIICARNEARNIRNFLPLVLEQNYPDFEVVVVNDCSEDETADILDLLKKENDKLRISTIQPDLHFSHSKKLPMLIGIKAARYDHLVFIDADCKPITENWLRSVAESYSEGYDIIAGYGGYLAEKGMLNKYIRFETMFIAMQYLGMAIAGRTYMAVGRNLAYRRSFFFDKGGFGPYNHVQSGDDDLFVNRNATSTNTGAIIGEESATISVPSHTFDQWARQKRRHYSTSKYYRFADKTRLFLEPFSRVSYYGLLLFFLITLISWPVVAAIALFRLITRAVIIKKATHTFNEQGIFFFSLFFDILHPLFSSVLYLTSSIKAKGEQTWK